MPKIREEYIFQQTAHHLSIHCWLTLYCVCVSNSSDCCFFHYIIHIMHRRALWQVVSTYGVGGEAVEGIAELV